MWYKGSIIIFISIMGKVSLCNAQYEQLSQLEALYSEEVCQCLEQQADLPAETLVYQTISDCSDAFITAHEEELKSVPAEKQSIVNLLYSQNVIKLIRSCTTYHDALENYKTKLMGQLNVSSETAYQAINEMIEREGEVDGNTNRAIYFTIIGVMYEYVEAYDKSLNYYDKALDSYPLTPTRGLRESLLLKK